MMGTQRHRDLRTNAGSAVLVPECSDTTVRNYCGIARLELPDHLGGRPDRLRGRIERAEALEIRVGVAPLRPLLQRTARKYRRQNLPSCARAGSGQKTGQAAT